MADPSTRQWMCIVCVCCYLESIASTVPREAQEKFILDMVDLQVIQEWTTYSA